MHPHVDRLPDIPLRSPTSELHLWPNLGWNPALDPADVGYFASGTAVSGRGGGEASGLKRMVVLPFEKTDTRILSVDGAGEVSVARMRR
jgi:hypothetical protein